MASQHRNDHVSKHCGGGAGVLAKLKKTKPLICMSLNKTGVFIGESIQSQGLEGLKPINSSEFKASTVRIKCV